MGSARLVVGRIPSNRTSTTQGPPTRSKIDGVGMTYDNLLTEADWVPMELENQATNPTYYWADGGLLRDSPADFVATFGQNMFTTTKPINVPSFNRNPLKVVPHFVVPRHHHNMDEMIFVFQGEYSIDHGEGDERQVTVVKPGQCFLSRAGTAYTMTSGPEGVTYIETWPRSVRELETTWYDVGWVHR
jgi:mannose-6-phosphate isomerase-like protein (cupin superfamily)